MRSGHVIIKSNTAAWMSIGKPFGAQWPHLPGFAV
jgi:hypothetical protein